MNLKDKLATVGIAVGLAIAPLAAATPALSHAAPAKAPDEVLVRAADWLSNQFNDGQYLTGFDATTPSPANTIDGALALVAAGTQGERVDQAVEWVRTQASDYVTDPTSAARAAILADAVGQDATDFGGVNLVTAMQGDLGEAAANPYGLGLLVIGLERTKTEVPATVVDALLATQEDDGAFGFPDFGVDIDSTAVAAQALALLGGNPQADEAAKQAVDWLVANQCTEVSAMCPTVGAYWGSYSPANTAGLAIPALRLAGVDTTEQLAWLVTQQEADGGFPPAIGAGYSDAYATAQALLGLAGADLAGVGQAGTVAGIAVSQPLIIGVIAVLVVLIVLVGVIVFRRQRTRA